MCADGAFNLQRQMRRERRNEVTQWQFAFAREASVADLGAQQFIRWGKRRPIANLDAEHGSGVKAGKVGDTMPGAEKMQSIHDMPNVIGIGPAQRFSLREIAQFA